MTNKTSPDPPEGAADMARFLQDWAALWGEELHAQVGDPQGMAAAMEAWRAAMALWAGTMRAPPRDSAAPPRAQAVAAASDARDAEVQRLARRVDERQPRLAKLETPRRRKG